METQDFELMKEKLQALRRNQMMSMILLIAGFIIAIIGVMILMVLFIFVGLVVSAGSACLDMIYAHKHVALMKKLENKLEVE
jgi:uncharacterized membrane protein